MVEVADVAVTDAPRDRDRSHHSVAHERTVDPRTATKLLRGTSRRDGGYLAIRLRILTSPVGAARHGEKQGPGGNTRV